MIRMIEVTPVRSAATVILWRRKAGEVQVLMGQRGASAAFMPSKYVFPGGAVDDGDAVDPLPLRPDCLRRLTLSCPVGAPKPAAIAGAALRELAEETGLRLAADNSPALTFFFRAITPPGRSRRFDARFFLADACLVTGDLDDFSAAEDELSHLHWIGLAEAKALDLPFITEVVLSEVAAHFAGAPDEGVPFFDNSGDLPQFSRLV